MASKFRYLEEMKETGYSTDTISDFHYECLSFLAKRFFPKKDSVIVDIGAGWGHCLIPLKREGYKNLTAIDVDLSASERLEKESIAFFNIDIEREKLPFQNSTVDVVLSFFVIAHLKDPANFLSETFRILRGGGTLIIVTPDWRKQYKTFWRDHTHVHPYDKVSIARILRCFKFEIIDVNSFGVFRGIGRLKLWKLWKSLMFTGANLIAIARKPSSSPYKNGA